MFIQENYADGGGIDDDGSRSSAIAELIEGACTSLGFPLVAVFVAILSNNTEIESVSRSELAEDYVFERLLPAVMDCLLINPKGGVVINELDDVFTSIGAQFPDRSENIIVVLDFGAMPMVWYPQTTTFCTAWYILDKSLLAESEEVEL